MQDTSQHLAEEYEAPAWFQEAIAQHAREADLIAGTTSLRTAAWNPADTHKPALLLVHGFLAGWHWWDAIAPALTRRFRVVAFDFSGMGDSGHRSHYTHDTWRDEVLAVAASLGPGKVHLVGHSFGGARALEACARRPDLFAQLVMVDSYVHADSPRQTGQGPWSTTQQPRLHADLEASLSRYRLVPDEPAPAFALRHVARHSVRRHEAGWGWKFDPSILSHPRLHEDARALLQNLAVPSCIVYGERSSIVSDAQVAAVRRNCPALRQCIKLAGAAHHLPLTHPLALTHTLDDVLT